MSFLFKTLKLKQDLNFSLINCTFGTELSDFFQT